jgi:hypothetical protein
MDSVPPVHGPARHLDDLLADLGHGAAGADDVDDAEEPGAPPDLPEVVEAVTGRARDLHRLADRLSTEQGEAPDGTLSAVALLRAHAGAVGDLAEHLQAAGGEHGTTPADPGAAPQTPATTGADVPGPDDADPAPDGAGGSSASGPRGVPRPVG